MLCEKLGDVGISKKKSKWVNDKWPLYICSECGDEFYSKYKDTNYCFSCSHLFEDNYIEIENANREADLQKNKDFAIKYKKGKNK